MHLVEPLPTASSTIPLHCSIESEVSQFSIGDNYYWCWGGSLAARQGSWNRIWYWADWSWRTAAGSLCTRCVIPWNLYINWRLFLLFRPIGRIRVILKRIWILSFPKNVILWKTLGSLYYIENHIPLPPLFRNYIFPSWETKCRYNFRSSFYLISPSISPNFG